MGTLLQAICECGLETDILYQGIGFSYPETGRQSEPGYCACCGVVAMRDPTKARVRCSRCQKKITFYKDEVDVVSSEDNSFSSSDAYLQAKQFWFCPRCHQETLQLHFCGCWD